MKNTPTRILVIQTAFIGDAILATALLEKLHYHFPESSIDFLVRKGNDSLFAGHPFIHNLLVWDKKKSKYIGLWKLLLSIRRSRYDWVINLQRFGATGLLTALSGASETIGFDKNPFSRFFSKSVPHRIGGTHEVQRNASLIESLTDQSSFKPKLYPTRPTNIALADRYICIAPTSVWFTKQFPEHRWIELIAHVPAHLTIYLLGAPSDVPACERIKTASPHPDRIQLVAGKISLLESAALMQGAMMNYVNDSAPMHLCSATDAPVCAVYCSTIPDFGFGPLSTRSWVVEAPTPLECRPCGLHGHKACPKGHFRCAEDIPISRLVSLLD